MSNPLAATSEATSRPLGSEVKLERLGRRERRKKEKRREKKRKVDRREGGRGEEQAFWNKPYHIIALFLWLCKIPFQVLKPLFLLHVGMEGVWLQVEHLQQGPDMMQTADAVDKDQSTSWVSQQKVVQINVLGGGGRGKGRWKEGGKEEEERSKREGGKWL